MASRQANSTIPSYESDSRADAVADFLAIKGLPPTTAWVRTFLDSARTNIPIQSLQQTALFRIQSGDITASVKGSSTNSLPVSVNDPKIQEFRLPGPVSVQLLDIEDIGSSVWSQIEAIESRNHGETTRGREVIRTIPQEPNEIVAGASHNVVSQSGTRGPHKFLVQDAVGTKMYCIDVSKIPQISLHTEIGAKMVLKNVLVARGVALLEPANIIFIGGRVEIWDRTWRESRLQRLQHKLGLSTEQA